MMMRPMVYGLCLRLVAVMHWFCLGATRCCACALRLRVCPYTYARMYDVTCVCMYDCIVLHVPSCGEVCIYACVCMRLCLILCDTMGYCGYQILYASVTSCLGWYDFPLATAQQQRCKIQIHKWLAKPRASSQIGEALSLHVPIICDFLTIML